MVGFLMARVGRRRIHFVGLCTQFLLLVVVGSLAFAGTKASVWAIGGALIAFTFVYDFTVGPVTYALVSELSSTRLKAKTIVLARAAYNASNIFVNVMTNYQLNSAAWNWSAKAAYLWAGTCGLSAVWVFFRLPEPKGWCPPPLLSCPLRLRSQSDRKCVTQIGPTRSWISCSKTGFRPASLRGPRSTRTRMRQRGSKMFPLGGRRLANKRRAPDAGPVTSPQTLYNTPLNTSMLLAQECGK